MDMDFYVSPERLEELKAELVELSTVKRIEVAKRLKRAKELGDLSENSEYIEAREEQSLVERRIYDVEQMIKNAILITKPAKGSATVQIGSTIEVEKEGKMQEFTIVGSSETRPESGLISNESPLGKAFLGREVGARVTVTVPKGKMEYTIVKIK